MAITVKDVAARAQVSVGTVSRVLNHDPTVRAVTLRAVEEAIAALGYTPNRAAQNLRRNRSGVIGLLVPEFRIATIFKAIAGIDEVVHEAGLELLVSSAERDSALELKRAESMLAQGIDGLIYFPISTDSRVGQLAADLGVPSVLLTNFRGVESNSVVITDWRPALAELMSDLAAHGHDKVAFMAQEGAGPLTEGRRSEFHLAASKTKPRAITVADVTVHDAERIAITLRALLEAPGAPTALAVSGEPLAIAVIGSLVSLGVRIPRHVSVVLFGLNDWSHLTTPTLASVGADLLEFGKRGARMLLERLHDGTPAGIAAQPGVYLRGESIGQAYPGSIQFFD